MSVLLRNVALRRLQVVLGLALLGLVFAPGASGAAQIDTVSATGSGGSFSNVSIAAQSGTSGQNVSGNASFTIGGTFNVGGPVTCLSVRGPDRGAGSAGSPTTAVLNFQDQVFGVFTVELVDNGGNGADIISAFPISRAPTDCSPFSGSFTSTLTNGRAVVVDAPVLPTSKEQCKNGGWQTFGVFKNQGDCVSFVATHGKNQPG